MYTVTANFDLIYENARREANNCLIFWGFDSGIFCVCMKRLRILFSVIVNKINMRYVIQSRRDQFIDFF